MVNFKAITKKKKPSKNIMKLKCYIRKLFSAKIKEEEEQNET